MKNYILIFLFLSLQARAAGPRTLIYAAHLNPPSAAEMGSIARLIEQGHFERAVILPTFTNLAGDGSPANAMKFTRASLSHFDEILDLNSIGYREFQSLSPGEASWTGDDGEPHAIGISTAALDERFDGRKLDGNPESLAPVLLAAGVEGSNSYWVTDFPSPLPGASVQFIRRPAYDADDKSVQPSVFEELVKGDHRQAVPEEAFTRESFEKYLRAILRRGEASSGDPELFNAVADNLVRVASDAAVRRENTPFYRAVLAKVFHEVVEHLNLVETFREARRKFGPMALKYGVAPAAVYLTGEIIEAAVAPAVTYAIGGETGLLFAPFFHPNDIFSLPALLAYYRLKTARENWLLAAPDRWMGDRRLYKDLTAYREELLGGKPEDLLARTALRNSLGIDGAAVIINHMKDHAPSWIRFWAKRAVKDPVSWNGVALDVTTLKALLGRPALAKELKDSAGEEDDAEGLYSRLLLRAVEQSPEAAARLEVYVGQKYFRKLAFGGIGKAFRAALSQGERDFASAMESANGGMPADVKADVKANDEMKDLIGDFLLAVRLAHRAPQEMRGPGFWDAFLDHLAAREPGGKLDPGKGAHVRALVQRLPVLATLLVSYEPKRFSGLSFAYGNELLGTIGDSPQKAWSWNNPDLRAAAEGATAFPVERALALISASRPAIARAMESRGGSLGPDRALTLGSMAPAGSDLLWRINRLRQKDGQDEGLLEAAYEQAQDFLKAHQAHARNSEKIFRDLLRQMQRKRQRWERALWQLEYDWLKAKRARPDAAEETLPEYAAIQQRLGMLAQEEAERGNVLRTAGHLMLGIEPAPLEEPELLRKRVGKLLGLPEERNRLGFSLAAKVGGAVHDLIHERCVPALIRIGETMPSLPAF